MRLRPLTIFVLFVLPLLLFIAQSIFTTASMTQIRWEEAGTALRKPYWVAHREINSGIDSNIGFDLVLNAVYSLIGIDLFTAKYVRLIIQFISLFSLAFLLRKYLGEKWAIVPLLTIGLSPTLLFFVSFQQQYGFDLQYLPITLALLVNRFTLLQFLGWATAAVAWMSYPTFGFYLPALVFVHLGGVKARLAKRVHLPGVLLSFLLPLVLGFVWIQNRQLLIFDPSTETGIFRGGGGKFFQQGSLDLSLSNLFSDLFTKGVSYNFDIAASEFSYVFPILTLVLVFFISFRLLKYNSYKKYVLLSFLVMIFSLVVYLATSDPTGMPGIRRATASLAAFYSLFTISWYYINKGIGYRVKGKVIMTGILLLLPLHHILVYYPNLAGLKIPGIYQEVTLFPESDLTPYQQYQAWIKKVQQEDVYLSCETSEPGSSCKFSDLYSVMASACFWNNLKCHGIYGRDPNTQQFIPLSRDLWNSGYLER